MVYFNNEADLFYQDDNGDNGKHLNNGWSWPLICHATEIVHSKLDTKLITHDVNVFNEFLSSSRVLITSYIKSDVCILVPTDGLVAVRTNSDELLNANVEQQFSNAKNEFSTNANVKPNELVVQLEYELVVYRRKYVVHTVLVFCISSSSTWV